MKNAVLDGSIALAAVERSLAERHARTRDEVARLIEAGISVMRSSRTVEPRVHDIIRTAGLSNQAFYRHFRSKDELLLAILDHGLRELVAHLTTRMSTATSDAERVTSWIEGMLDQARNRVAADATRAFVLDSFRLTARFPDETRRSFDVLITPLRDTLSSPGRRDAEADATAIHHLTRGLLETHLARGTEPTEGEVAHVVGFALRGVGLGG